MPIETRWYVVHTYSGYENKVADSIVKMLKTAKCRISSLRSRSRPRQ